MPETDPVRHGRPSAADTEADSSGQTTAGSTALLERRTSHSPVETVAANERASSAPHGAVGIVRVDKCGNLGIQQAVANEIALAGGGCVASIDAGCRSTIGHHRRRCIGLEVRTAGSTNANAAEQSILRRGIACYAFRTF